MERKIDYGKIDSSKQRTTIDETSKITRKVLNGFKRGVKIAHFYDTKKTYNNTTL